MSLDEALKQFGISGFREGQREVIEAALVGRDVFACFATGHGKSLCYQLPPVVGGLSGSKKRDVAIVVSPLISLMQDQVIALRARGISATYIAHTLAPSAEKAAREGAEKGEFRLVYVTPERVVLWTEAIATLHAAQRLALFAIDESHVVSEWGHEFRPEYRRLGLLRHQFPDVPIMALTATATPVVRSDIIAQLRLMDPLRVVLSFNRPNLFYVVKEKSPRALSCEADLGFLANEPKQPTIVYAPSIQETATICLMLASKGVACAAYNSTLVPQQRIDTHEKFLSGELQVVVATVAFGMGIDKPDIRRVIHYGPPRSIEAFYQQSGRAGRDGLPAECILFWEPKDFGK